MVGFKCRRGSKDAARHVAARLRPKRREEEEGGRSDGGGEEEGEEEKKLRGDGDKK